MANYKCEDCDKEFNSFMEVIDCPRCGSHKLTDLSNYHYEDDDSFEDGFDSYYNSSEFGGGDENDF